MNLNVPWKGLALAWLACVVLAYFGLVMAKLGILVIPAIALVLFLVGQGPRARAAHEARLRAFAPGFDHAYLSIETGIAVNTATRTVRLRYKPRMKREVVRDYPFESVREVEKVILRGGEVFASHVAGGNVTAAVGASAANAGIALRNARISRENAAKCGLFVSVKDIDHPKWQVWFPEEKQMDRWMEILRQALSD